MGDDWHEPPPGLSEEELRRWQQWRKFVWMEGDIVITRRGDGKKPEEGADARQDDEQPGDSGS